MGAFIISAIGNNFADSEKTVPLLAPIPNPFRRRILVVIYFSIIFSLLIFFGKMRVIDFHNL